MKTLRKELPEFWEVSAHPGRLDPEALEPAGEPSPSVRIALQSVQRSSATGTGEIDARVELTAFAVAQDAMVLTVVDTLLPLVHRHCWGVEGAQTAIKVTAANLSSARLSRQGVAIWALTWHQDLRIGESLWDDNWGSGT